MTIKDYIIDGTITALMDRENRMKELGAPAIIITTIGEEIDRLMKKELRCGGEKELLDEEMVSVEKKKGRGGIPYYVFNGDINYFPKAKYGRFIAKGERK